MKLTGRVVQVTDANIDRALRKFRKKIDNAGLLKDLRNKEFYEKPTTERKRKRDAAINRWNKKLAGQALPKKFY